jgi:shikimate kinase
LNSLIILRGPAGSGKSTVCKYLRKELGTERTCSLDLDITGVNEDKFNDNLRNCLTFEYVIGMMFYGNSHNEQPQQWITKFKDRNYRILSVVLHANMDLSYDRCKNDNNPERHPINKQKEQGNKYYHEFEQRQNENIFQEMACVEEIIVDSKNKTQTQVGDEILRYLKLI